MFTDEERVARDDEGNAIYVPSDMTYHEWKEKFVDGDKSKGLENIAKLSTITDTDKKLYMIIYRQNLML